MCPVTAATLAISATATSGFAAVAVGAVAGAAAGAAIGVGVSGVVNVATGRGFFEGAGKSALFGAIGGAFGGALGGEALFGQGITPLSNAAAGYGQTALQTAQSISSFAPSAMGIGLTAAAGSLLGSLTPGTPEYSSAIQAARDPQQNSQNITTSGSGGSQARFSLASAIQRSKERKLTQKDVSDLSIDTGSFASTGLQFA